MIWCLSSLKQIRANIIELIVILLINVLPVDLYSCVSLIRHYCSDGSKSNDDPLAINKVIRKRATTKQKAQWMQMETHTGDQLRDKGLSTTRVSSASWKFLSAVWNLQNQECAAFAPTCWTQPERVRSAKPVPEAGSFSTLLSWVFLF